MANASILRTRVCLQCGTSPITGYKFCSPECRYAAFSEGIGRLPQKRASEQLCAVCSKAFTRWKSAGRDAGLCCSRACGFDLMRQRGGETRALTAERQVYRRWAANARKRARELERHARLAAAHSARDDALRSIARKPCATCQGPAGYRGKGRAPLFCSADCREGGETAQANRRAYRATRKARVRAATVERFDPIEVLDRDRWRCHLCGIATPKRLRGTYAPSAPELDHIIPLSKGGEHSRRNTACACRACNLAKGDKPLGQLKLVA